MNETNARERTVPYYACKHGVPGGCAFCNATEKPRAGEQFRRTPDVIAQLEADNAALRERERELLEVLKAASEALRSSRHIMSDSYNRELAVELADKCDAAIAKHGR